MVTSETRYPANKEMFKVNCKNTIRIHEAYSKLTTKISEARHRANHAFFIADFKQIYYNPLLSFFFTF